MSIQPPKDKEERDARLDLVLATIEANPSHWDQSDWHCGTSHCFAGFAQYLAVDWNLSMPATGCFTLTIDGKKRAAWDDAEVWLGIDGVQSSRLFCGGNSFCKLESIVSEIKQTPYLSPGSGQHSEGG